MTDVEATIPPKCCWGHWKEARFAGVRFENGANIGETKILRKWRDKRVAREAYGGRMPKNKSIVILNEIEDNAEASRLVCLN